MTPGDGEHDVVRRRRALPPRQQAALGERLRRAASGAPSARAIPRRTGEGPARLSFAQQRLWFLDQLSPGNPFYNIPATLPWSGRLDLKAFQWAVDELVRRHESLRTVFRSTPDGPVQVALPAGPQRLRLVDLRPFPPGERVTHADAAAAAEAAAPFDLATGPPLRICVLRLEDLEFRVLLTLHHIVADGWSMGVLLRELSVLYRAATEGRASPLPEPHLQYADYAEWQRGWLVGDRLEEQLAYWRHRLDDLPTLNLLADYPRPQAPTFSGENLPVRIGAETTSAVRSLAAAQGATPFMVLLTAWVTVLHRATGQPDVVVGAPIANRLRPELEALVGFFVNSLVLRVDASGDPSGRELLDRIRTVTIEAYGHQDLPFEKLVEELQPDRDLGRNPLTQVTFQLQNAPTADGTLPADDDVHLEPGTRRAIFDLALSLWETRTSLVGMAQFSTELFDRATVQSLVSAFEVAVAELVTSPDTALSQLRLLTADQQDEIVRRSRGRSVEIPPVTLHQLVLRSCRLHPDAVAVQAGTTEVSYAALDAWSACVAAALAAEGVGRGDVVGVCVPRSTETVVAMLGVLRAGAAYLPLDESLPAHRLHTVLREAGARTVLVGTDGAAPSLPPGTRPVPVPDRPHREGSPTGDDVHTAADEPAYVVSTSGSTGAPLSVSVTHRALVNHMWWMATEFPLSAEDRVLQRTPVHFDASVWEFWAPLLAGARLVLYPGRWVADTAALSDTLRGAGVTHLQVVPSLLALLLDEPTFALADRLRLVFCGGEQLPPSLVARFHSTWRSDRAPELVNLYGPTEATIDATSWRCDADGHARVPIGEPVTNLTGYVLDHHRRPVPGGFPGELYLAGAGLSAGYPGHPAVTEERFVDDPFDGSRLMYRTGDRVRRRADGALEFLGRTDHQLKLRGLRIEPAEVEACLSGHPDVDEALVTAVERPDGQSQLVAYVAVGAAADDSRVDGDLVDAHVRDWRSVYDRLYAEESSGPDAASGTEGEDGPTRQAPADPTFDTVGWTSSYDGLPIGAAEMRTWLDETVARILALHPRRVLEIGAGTGLVALRVAPYVEDYLAVDFSAAAVEALVRSAEAAGVGGALRTGVLAAHELESLEESGFDLVILNSVVQYFPGLNYLDRVVDAATRRLAEGGAVFLGDVRSRPLLAPFHLSVLLAEGGESESWGAALDQRLGAERELVIDPRWFAGLTQPPSPFTTARVMPKTTPHATELTRFRYDVVLSSRSATTTGPADVLDWGQDVRTLDALGAALGPRTEAVVVGLPNGRTLPEATALAALRAGGGASLAELTHRADLARVPVDPHLAVQAVRRLGLDAVPLWTRTGPDGGFDLVVAEDRDRVETLADQVARTLRPEPVHGQAAATTPLSQRIGERVAPALRARAQERLPAYMVPERVVVLPRFPLLANGKVARQRLPSPDGDRPIGDADLTPPSGPVETVLAEVWGAVLGVHKVGARDDFFSDLGGHSLLATRLVSRLREILDVDVPLRLVFEAPTVAQMAAALTDPSDALHPGRGERVTRVASILVRVRDMTEAEAADLVRAPSPT